MKLNLYTMAVNFEKDGKEVKTYEETTAYSKREAIDNINDRYSNYIDYLGCYVYDVEEAEHPDIEDMMETRC